MTDKLELKSCHEVIYTVNVEDVESIFYCKPTDPDILTVLMKDGRRLYCDEVCPSMQEEPVSKDLEEATQECIEGLIPETELNSAAPFSLEYVVELLQKTFEAGAQWYKSQLMKDAIDAEVVGIKKQVLDDSFGYVEVKGNYKKGDKLKVLIIKND